MIGQKANIYDAYLYKYKKFILALSYTPGLDIQPIIDDMSKTFNFVIIKLNGPTNLNVKTVLEFDYNKLNIDIEKILEENEKQLNSNIPGMLGKGILLYGLNFPEDKIKTSIDLQLHYSASISMFLKANVDENNIPLYTIDDYNNFKDIMKENKINKYFNIKSVVGSELNDSTFEKLIDFFEYKVYGKDYNIYSTKAQNENASKSLVNPNPTDVLEISKKNEIIKNEIVNDDIDIALSIAADNADYSGEYNTKKKETAKYINKKIEESFTESDMQSDWDSDTDTNTDSDTDTDSDSNTNSNTNTNTNTNTNISSKKYIQNGGAITSNASMTSNSLNLIDMTDSELEQLLDISL